MFLDAVWKLESSRGVDAIRRSVREHGRFLASLCPFLVLLVVGISFSDELYDRFWHPAKVTITPIRTNELASSPSWRKYGQQPRTTCAPRWS